MQMQRPVIVANWKMNKTVTESLDYIREFLGYIDKIDTKKVEIVISPSFTAIKTISDLLSGKDLYAGAQNIYQAEDGPFTGEISARQIAELGCRYVILGHCERRRFLCETSEMINKKIISALSYGIIPILCIGETLDERRDGRIFKIIGEQIERSLSSLPPLGKSDLVIAYEPVWAIGTGLAATTKEVAQVHSFVRKEIQRLFKRSDNSIRIIYGGSVTPENIGWIMAEPDVDGVLVGNASLRLESFIEMIKKSIEIIKIKNNF